MDQSTFNSSAVAFSPTTAYSNQEMKFLRDVVTLVSYFVISVYAMNKLGCLIRPMLECISFLRTALSASTSIIPSHLYVCLVRKLDPDSFLELNKLLRQHMEVALDDNSICRKLKATYSHVAMARSTMDGSLQGFIYYAVVRGVLDSRKYTFINCGPMVFRYKYRRNVTPLLVLMFLVLYELTFHPKSSVYFVGKSTTYLSYLSGLSKTQLYYPRYDCETPPFEEKLLHKFAEIVCSLGESYNNKTLVLERELIKFKPEQAFITEEDMKNPHIRFFAERNPGWRKGHSMLVIGKMTWWQVIRLLCRIVNIARSKGNGVTRGSKRRVESQLRKIRDRHPSFQSDLAKREVSNQYWVKNDKLQHRKLSSYTQLDPAGDLDVYDHVDF